MAVSSLRNVVKEDWSSPSGLWGHKPRLPKFLLKFVFFLLRDNRLTAVVAAYDAVDLLKQIIAAFLLPDPTQIFN
jgi:hypothetical protein